MQELCVIYDIACAIQRENFIYVCPVSLPPEFKGGIWMVYPVQLILSTLLSLS